MAVKRTYVGEPGRYFPDFGVTPEPGDTVTFATADQVPDDGRWETPAAKRAKKPAAKRTRRARDNTPPPVATTAEQPPDSASTTAPSTTLEEN